MNCVIVGAAGFVGRHLGDRCCELGHEVLGLDAAGSNRDRLPSVPVRRCDAVTDELDLPQGIDVVYYLAQSPHYRTFPIGAGHLFAVNVAGALRAAEAAQSAGAKLFCYASTGAVYHPAFGPWSEDHLVRRDEPYALSKVAAEEALALLPGPLQVVCVRLFGVFGPGQRGMLVPTVIARIQQQQPVILQRHPEDQNDRDGLRISLSYVKDVVIWLEQIAAFVLAGQAIPSVLNLAGPKPVSIRSLAEQIGELLGVQPRFEMVDQARASDYVADISRFRALTTPAFTPLREAIASTLAQHVP